jgi:hypothetical protein
MLISYIICDVKSKKGVKDEEKLHFCSFLIFQTLDDISFIHIRCDVVEIMFSSLNPSHAFHVTILVKIKISTIHVKNNTKLRKIWLGKELLWPI